MALALVQWGYDWDWSAADLSMRRALELAPRNADVILAAAFVAANLGHLDQAIGLCRRAIALDPFNVLGHRYLGLSL
jgi:cytochrome c-type biogenesis protein CcmH/NrfG